MANLKDTDRQLKELEKSLKSLEKQYAKTSDEAEKANLKIQQIDIKNKINDIKLNSGAFSDIDKLNAKLLDVQKTASKPIEVKVNTPDKLEVKPIDITAKTDTSKIKNTAPLTVDEKIKDLPSLLPKTDTLSSDIKQYLHIDYDEGVDDYKQYILDIIELLNDYEDAQKNFDLPNIITDQLAKKVNDLKNLLGETHTFLSNDTLTSPNYSAGRSALGDYVNHTKLYKDVEKVAQPLAFKHNDGVKAYDTIVDAIDNNKLKSAITNELAERQIKSGLDYNYYSGAKVDTWGLTNDELSKLVKEYNDTLLKLDILRYKPSEFGVKNVADYGKQYNDILDSLKSKIKEISDLGKNNESLSTGDLSVIKKVKLNNKKIKKAQLTPDELKGLDDYVAKQEEYNNRIQKSDIETASIAKQTSELEINANNKVIESDKQKAQAEISTSETVKKSKQNMESMDGKSIWRELTSRSVNPVNYANDIAYKLTHHLDGELNNPSLANKLEEDVNKLQEIINNPKDFGVTSKSEYIQKYNEQLQVVKATLKEIQDAYKEINPGLSRSASNTIESLGKAKISNSVVKSIQEFENAKKQSTNSIQQSEQQTANVAQQAAQAQVNANNSIQQSEQQTASNVVQSENQIRQAEQQTANVAQQAAQNQVSADNQVQQSAHQTTQALQQESDTQLRAQEAALNKKLQAVRQHIEDENRVRAANRQNPMSASEEAAYYNSQLSNFGQNTRQYQELLILRNQAEQNALNQSRQTVSTMLNGIKSFANAVNNAVNKIVGFIRGAINLTTKIISGVGRIITTLTSGVKHIIGLFGGLSNRVRGTGNDFNFFKNSATELRSKIQLLKGAFNTLFNNSMVNNASKLIGSVTSLNIIIGKELTNSTIEWAKSMQDAFGVDARGLIAELGEMTGVLHGLGMEAQDVANGATNFVTMSRYLGMIGLAGGDANQVMSKLTSGMKGMTASVDDLGLSVREAEMDSFLKDLQKQGGVYANIGTSFSTLNEEARVYVRYAALMNQFAERFGEKIKNADGTFTLKLDVEKFHKSLNSVTGRLSLVKESFNGMISALGTGFAKIAAFIGGMLIPVFNFLTSKITSLFAWLSELTGLNLNVDIEQADTLFNDTGAEEAKKDIEDVNEELEKTEEKAKKAKGSLQGFDRVNNVTTPDNESGAGDTEFDYSSLADGFGKLLDPTQFDKAYASFLDKLQAENAEWLNKMKEKLDQWFKDITGRDTIDFGFDFGRIKENLKTVWNNIKKLFKQWGTFFIEIGVKLADDINIGKIFTKFTELLSSVSKLATAFSNVLIPVLDKLYEKYLKPIVTKWGEDIVETLDTWIEKIQTWTEYFSGSQEAVASDKLEQRLEGLISVFKGDKDPEGLLEGLVGVLGAVFDVAKALAPIVIELTKSFGTFFVNEILPWLVEKLRELADWLTKNKETIIELVKKIAGIAWTGFKIFVDLIGKLIDFVVKHPGVVIGFFAGLLALKVGSWFLSTAAGLGNLVLGLSNLITVISGAGGLGAWLSGIATSVSTALAPVGTALSATGSAVVGGLGTVGTAFGSGATTAGGLAVAGGASIAGVALGGAGLIDGITDLVDATKANTEEEKKAKQWSGGTKIGMVGAGAAAGAAIGSVIPGIGTAVGAAVGAGVGGLTALIKGDEAGSWVQETWNNNIKPFFTETLPQFFTETLPNTFNKVKERIGTFFTEDIPTFFSNLWDSIDTFFTETIPQALGIIAGNITVFFTETVPTFFSNIWDGVDTFFTETLPTVLGEITANLSIFFTETIPNKISELWDNVTTFMTETLPQTLETVSNKVHTFLTVTIPNKLSTIWTRLTNFLTNTIPNAVDTIKSAIKTFFTETIPNKIRSFFGKLGSVFNNFKVSYEDTVASKSSATTARSVTSHAVGGSIAGGQLFIANENGQPELIGNIDGSPKTNVANNNMIIEAMTNGVFTGVYNALAEVGNQRASVGGGVVNPKIEINGFGLIDSSTLNELARLLAPYQNSNNKNIADIGFSI